MKDIKESIGFLRGLLEGMDAEKKQTTEGKALTGIVELLADMDQHMDGMEGMLAELNDYVESIDDDLAALEDDGKKDTPFGKDEDDIIEGEEDEDDAEYDEEPETLHLLSRDDDCDEDEELAGGICPECGGVFFVDANDERDYACPHCGKSVKQIPLTPDNVPRGKPID